MRLQQALLLSLTTILLGLSTWIAFVEIRPFLVLGASQLDRYQAHLAGRVLPGFSSKSHMQTIEGCFEATTTVYGRLQPTNQRMSVIDNCDRQLDKIIANAPTNALAWYAKSLMAALRKDTAEMNLAMATGRTVSPNAQWIAELRVALSESERDQLSAANLIGNDADLQILLRSQSGVEAIIRQYVSVPSFRQRIIELVETLDDDQQRAFVEHLRAAVRNTKPR